MKRIYICISLFLLTLSLFAQNGVLFEFNHVKDDASSYTSTVEENVYYNGYLSHHAQIVNRISSVVNNVDEEGTGFITANYMTTENSLMNYSNNHLSWGTESSVDFYRKKNGELIISDSLFMPTVRNVPVFPSYKVKPGESWEAEGKEVHDLRSYFNMDKPLIIPFNAKYTYIGDKIINGNKRSVINVEYKFYYENSAQEIRKGSLFCATAGFSKQTLYWDCEKGILDFYEESFQIKMSDIYDNIVEFSGSAKAEFTEAKNLNNRKNIESLQNTVDSMKLKDVNVKQGERGLTISIENIQFEPDSAVLLNDEKIKLNKIAEILKSFNNDILITGHCAERGTENARLKLSQERAQSVADYLLQQNVRDSYHIFSQGKGSAEPIASNDTEDGRRKNRRVEITILN